MRIALILPQRRLGSWHERLAQSLAKKHEVAVLVDDSASPYPLAIRAWLNAEKIFYREQRTALARFAERFPRLHGLDESEFDVIVDLAERAVPRPKSISIRYSGLTDSMALVNRLLGGQTPHLAVCGASMNDVLAESWPAIDDKSRLTRGLQLSFGRCISLVERALRSIGRGGAARQFDCRPAPLRGIYSFASRFVVTKVTKATLGKFPPTHRWSIAIRNQLGPFVPVADDGQRYYADPFLYASGGRMFVFAEEYRLATKKGVISAAEIIGDQIVGAPIRVLEQPYHLSYPLVFADSGAIYMLPETAQNKTVELYRAVEFPWKWQLERVLIEGIALADATPVYHGDYWWLFATSAENGTTDHDELFIFYSDKLVGPWRPHAGNPVKSDCRSARPAGRILGCNGRLLRPAQDCEERYGSGIVWQEIVELSPSRFREREVARFKAPDGLAVNGIHTFNQIGNLQVIDVNAVRGLLLRRGLTRDAMLRLGSNLDLACQPLVR